MGRVALCRLDGPATVFVGDWRPNLPGMERDFRQEADAGRWIVLENGRRLAVYSEAAKRCYVDGIIEEGVK